MDIIKELAAMCHEVFAGGSVQYAYTTIPTYPRYDDACDGMSFNTDSSPCCPAGHCHALLCSSSTAVRRFLLVPATLPCSARCLMTLPFACAQRPDRVHDLQQVQRGREAAGPEPAQEAAA